MATTDGLVEPLKSAAELAVAVGAQQGKNVSVVSGLRTREQQISLRRAHCGPTQYDIYEKPSSQCRPPTARPGSSKHETGQAVDMGGDYAWIKNFFAQFNIVTTVPGEPWHFEYRGNDPAGTLKKIVAVGRDRAITVAPIGGSASGTVGSTSIIGKILSGHKDDIETLLAIGGDVIPSTELGGIPVIDSIVSVGRLASNLTDRDFWVRIGWGALGITIAVFGLILMFGRPAAQVALDAST